MRQKVKVRELNEEIARCPAAVSACKTRKLRPCGKQLLPFVYASKGLGKASLLPTFNGDPDSVPDVKAGAADLANWGRRLLQAQEKERAWIARELHDDIVQRIALLNCELLQWSIEIPASAAETHSQIKRACHHLSEIAGATQALAHRLHSSKLEHLGLANAAGSFCKEVSKKCAVRVDFHHTNVPLNLPSEVAFTFFRVLQEALWNAVKHSGARRFKVELQCDSGAIALRVRDFGNGFNPAAAALTDGLGLTSMQERAHSIDADFSICSKPERGTTVYIRVPLAVSHTETRERVLG